MQLPQIQEMKRLVTIFILTLWAVCLGAKILNYTICQGDSVRVNGKYYNTSGVYYDTLDVYEGTDSIIELHLQVIPHITVTTNDTICSGDYCTFRGKRYYNAGTYYDTLVVANACDTVFRLNLTVNPQHRMSIDTTICDNAALVVGQNVYTQAGTYYDTLPGRNNDCDTFVVTNLTIQPSATTTITLGICAESSFYYRDILIDKPGIYFDTLIARNGCDSIIRLVVNENPSYLTEDIAYICEGDSNIFFGKTLKNEGTYTEYLKTKDGCDSIFVRTVVAYKKDTVWLNIHHCNHKPYYFHGQQITDPGTYTRILTNRFGCDSTIILNYDTVPYYYQEKAHICEGETYIFHGDTVSTQGTHFISIPGECNCDTTYELSLTVGKRYEFVFDTTVCNNTPFFWRGKQYTTSGTYTDHYTSSLGCDSTYTLNLTFIEAFHNTEVLEFCHGDSLVFKNHVIQHTTNINDTLISVTGCDSIVHYHFNMLPTFLFRDTITLCVNSSYNWHGKTINRSGVYWDSLKTISGCDSIYNLVVIATTPQTTTVNATICNGEYYQFNGKRYSVTGTYYDTVSNYPGCENAFILHLSVNPTYLTTTEHTECSGTSVYFRGKQISKPGIYYDSLFTHEGCDSVFKMIFNWTPTYLFADTIRLCKGDTYNFHGRRITSSGVYYDSLATTAGCDSIYKLVVYTSNNTFNEQHINLCSNDVYFFHGKRITQSGIYWDSLATVNGCDSITKYIITFDSSKTTTIYADICSNDIYYKSDGTAVNKSGIYLDTLFTPSGCDSIVRLILNVHADKIFEETKSICNSNYYSWRGRNLTSTGVYWDSLVTADGCDSVFKLNLVNNTYYTEIDTTLCDNSIFRFNNKNYTSSGIYYDTLMTVLGCDSVFKIDLTINPSYNIVRHLTICDTDYPVPFAGGFVNQTGVYNDTTVTLQGCDSINTLYLTVVQTYYFMEDTICEDGIYSWRGHQYTQPGLYTDTVRDQTEAHCDIIYALRLHTVQKTNLYSLDMAPYICADDIEFAISPRYTGTKPDAYTIRYTSAEISKQSDIVNANFTSSPILVPLPLSVDGDSLRPDTYTGTLEVYNRVCDANPLSLDFTLNIRYPSYIVNQHWNDVVAILNSKYNGGYTFSKYDWYVNGILIQSITGSNMFLPNLRTGDKVEVGLTREGESYAVLTCPIWMQDLSNLEVSEYPVAVEGTILRNNTQAHIIASAAGTYGLYSAAGLLITSGTFDKDSETLVALPAVSGIYFLRVTSNNEPRTFKLLVQ